MVELIARGEKAINVRYRPMRFSEVIGMTSNKGALEKWLAGGSKRSRALLLYGSYGSGKTTMARILAMGLNCERGDTAEPCLECNSCKAAMADTAMHISEYNMSALSCKDDADAIVRSMSNSSLTGRNRIFILDEVQGMSTGSQNLLLKTLESPPPNTYVILCTTDPQKLLKTLRSRCELYEFKNPSLSDIKTMLATVVRQEMPEMKVEQRKEILESCKGLSYREILLKLDKFIKGGSVANIADAFQADYFGFAKLIVNGDYLQAIDYITNAGDDFEVEAARRVLRTFVSNQITYSMKEGHEPQAKRYAEAFQYLDKGFYTDPNPMPSFKTDLFLVCMAISGK